MNLAAKLIDERFATDLSPLVPEWPAGCSKEGGSRVVERVLQAEK